VSAEPRVVRDRAGLLIGEALCQPVLDAVGHGVGGRRVHARIELAAQRLKLVPDLGLDPATDLVPDAPLPIRREP
jgi:hypothetical protein